jgi:Flp pilus assembly protein TadG
MVEFAIAGGIFSLLLLGVLEFGTVAWVKNSLSESARDGARWAMVRGAKSGRTTNQAGVAAYVSARSGVNPVQVVATWPGTKDPGEVVIVQVKYFYKRIGLIIPSDTLRSTSRVRIVF